MYELNMKTSTMYRMREKALSLINGGHDESYALLPAYVEMIKETNPDSYAICAWTVMNTPEKPLQFKSLFVSFNAQFRGLIEGCRSLIGVDGTHLMGNHGGVLLSAITMDGNNEIFPVAVGVVEAENKETWSNFFDILSKCFLKVGEKTGPSYQIGRRELSQHWTKYDLYVTEGFVQDICAKISKKTTLGWFMDLGNHEHWARYMFDPRVSNDENISNFVESFNNTLGVHRNNPVLSLLEGIRRISMVRHATRQHVAESWPDDGICPNIRDRLRVLKKESKFCEAFSSSAKACYEVRDGRTYLPVSLTNRTCKCVAKYKAAYGLSILPIPDSSNGQ
ncbi:uncharacterized protein LOC141641850 [Silene latifolia]|uniref:uncharacterized protein LOC141641850 n=1 Tax=Silene latifolia TaxID=37657 RepID=UPI003D77E8CC